ncbi:hypothetical protein QE152_g24335 [Popillia japonica]|uniref:Uncharacterized protein n=1 Tax=Popillia japonica TaxID=7064 RepID=A0AAW1KBS5_POPJA
MYGCYDATTDLVVATNAIPDYRAQEVKGDVTLYPPSIIGKLRGRVSTTAFKNILSFNVSLERGRFALLSVPVFVYKSSEQTQPARHQREASAPPPRTPLPNAHTPSFIAFMTGRRTKRQAEEESRLKLSTFLRTTTFSASDCLRFLMLPRILPHGS